MALDNTARLDAIEAALRFVSNICKPEHPSDVATAQAAKQLATSNPNAAALIQPLLDWAAAMPGA